MQGEVKTVVVTGLYALIVLKFQQGHKELCDSHITMGINLHETDVAATVST